jgi:hypothetical protein
MPNLLAPDNESFTSLLARFSRLTLATCVRRRSGKERAWWEKGEHDISSCHFSQTRNGNTLQLIECSQNAVIFSMTKPSHETAAQGASENVILAVADHFFQVYASFLLYSLTLLILSSNLRGRLV